MRLSIRLGVLAVAPVALAAGVGLRAQTILAQQTDDGLLINLAGRQRMLTQKLTKELLAVARSRASGDDPRAAAEQARATAAIFDQTLAALIDGGAAPTTLSVAVGAPTRACPAASGEVRAQLEKVRAMWRPFLADTEHVLANDAEAAAALPRILAGNVPLLKTMNKGVGLMQAAAEAKLARLQDALNVGGLLALALAVLAAFWAVGAQRAMLRCVREVERISAEVGAGRLRVIGGGVAHGLLPEFAKILSQLTALSGRYAAVLDALPLPVIAHRTSGEVVFANARARVGLGVPLAEDLPLPSALSGLASGQDEPQLRLPNSTGDQIFRTAHQPLRSECGEGTLVCLLDQTDLVRTAEVLTQEAHVLQDSLQQMAQGDLLSRYARSDDDAQQTFARIERSLDDARTRLSQTLGSVKSSSEALRSSSETLDDAGQRLFVHANDATARVERAVGEVQTIADRAAHVGDAMRQLEGAFGSVTAETRTAVEILETASASAQRTDTLLEEFRQASAEVADIIAVISDVADQTELLALNANIEAAAAGDAGRGFGVVAEEVKALAHETRRAAERAEERSQRSAQIAQVVDRALEEVVAAMARLSALETRIADEMTTQSGTTERVSTEIDAVARSCATLRQEVGALADATRGTLDQAETATGIGREVASLAADLDRRLSGFRLPAA